MKDITVLMTGAGAPGAPGIISCYKNNGERNIRIIGVDMQSRVPSMLLLDEFETVPSAGSPDFIDAVLEIAKRHGVDAIQPLVTRELELFAENAERFEDSGIKVCVSSAESLHTANDKGLLLDKLRELGIDVPFYIKVNNASEFPAACKSAGYPGRPVCFKPSRANGSRGFRIIDDSKDRGRLLFEQKPDSTFIRFEEACEIISSMPSIPELLVMEYLPGKEYSVDMLMDRGKALYCIPRLRTRMNGGISVRCIIQNNHQVIEYCNKIASSLGLHGNVGIQVRYSMDDKVKILEINPRVQGSIVACAAAGANLPYYAIKLALGESIPQTEVMWGTEMVRHWKEVYFDAAGHAFAY